MGIAMSHFKSTAIGVCLIGAAAAIYVFGASRYEDGRIAERGKWQKLENTELAAANARIIKLESDARQLEREHAAAMTQASATYQESMQHEKATRDRVIADLRSGALRLRVDLASRQGAAGDPAGATGAAAGRCDGEARAELSVSASEFLVGLAAEADAVVHQLAACQAVVIADRKINQP